MATIQVVNPNLDPVAYDDGKLLLSWRGECLATLRAAFGAPPCGATATAGWNNTQGKHEDRNFPVAVYFPIWFSGAGGDGHACFAFINSNGQMNIWTSPWEEDKPYFDNYPSIERLEQGYEITFIGWSEFIGNMRVIEIVPDPIPVAEIVHAPIPEPSSNVVYTKLDIPLNLVTNKQPTHWWALNFVNDSNAVSQAELPQGTSFLAYGKAQRTDGDKPCYYMIEEDFGQADTTGNPTNNNGVNTVDLSPAPEPAETPAQVATPGTSGLASASPPMSDIVPQKPSADPNAWQKKTIKNIADYILGANFATGLTVHDLSNNGNPDLQLLDGQTFHAYERFIYTDGKEYVRTKKSADNGWFYGVALDNLELVKSIDIGLDTDSILDDLDMGDIGYKIKDAAALAERVIDPLFKNNTLREKIVDLVARFVFRAKKQKI